MEQQHLNKTPNDRPALGETLRHFQFGLVDALRQMQGDLFASFGFGPNETSYRIMASGSHWRLRDYSADGLSNPLLIVAAPIKRPYIWDLAPPVSVVRRCRDAGFRVYLLEWLPASEKTPDVGITASIEAIRQALATIASNERGSRPALMGHSLGGTLAAIYAAVAPDAIDRLVLLQSPLCFAERTSSFRDALISLVPGKASDLEPYPGSLLSQASAAAAPETFVWSRLLDGVLSFADSRAMAVHARVERWFLDEMPLPGKLVSEIVEQLYRENQFCRGILKVGEQEVRPADIAAPIMAVINLGDRIAPLETVRPLAEACRQMQIVEFPEETGVGLQHLGILVGRQAHAQVWPKIIDWIASPHCD